MAGFSGLGLGYLGDEKKYFGEPGPSEMPGFLQGMIDVPKAYATNTFIKPAINYLQNKMAPVPPPATPLNGAPVIPLNAVPNANAAISTSAISIDPNADHPLLDGLTKSNPY